MREKIEKIKIKIPKLYVVGIIILIAFVLFVAGIFLDWFSLKDIFWYMMTFVLGWVVILILAILGAGLIGMLFGYRIFAIRNFTPFEEGVLEMKDDLREIKEKLKILEEELKKK